MLDVLMRKRFAFFLGDLNEERLEHLGVAQTRHLCKEDSAAGSVSVGLGRVAQPIHPGSDRLEKKESSCGTRTWSSSSPAAC